jgi:hypothetical protein
MNIFQADYDTRLKNWYSLKQNLKLLDIKQQCVEVDDWWQQAPLVNRYLHTMDTTEWPDPWELLVENTYCEVARALGMCYTLYMSGVTDIEMVEASDNMGNDLVLVLVDSAKYILNYWPDTVVNNCLQDFRINRTVNIQTLLQKL